MEHLTQEFFIENSSINVEFPNNRSGEKTSGAYLWELCWLLIITFKFTLWRPVFFSIWFTYQRWNWKNVSHRYSSFVKVWFIAVIGKSYEISILLKLPSDLQVQYLKLKCTESKTGTTKSGLKSERKKNVSSLGKKM